MLVILKKKMFMALLCFLPYIMGSSRATRDGYPGYYFYPELHGYLKLHEVAVDWLAARVNCYYDDALLAAPWTDEFTRIIHKLQTEKDLLPAVYSGAHMTLPEGVFKYVEGEPVVSLEPKNLKSLERCIIFLANGNIGTVDCEQRLPYVCYAPLPACGEKTVGYEFGSRTGGCYKFHTVANAWLTANSICQAEGAHLAIINSDAEGLDLVELMHKYPANTLSSYIKDYVAIGVYYRRPQGAWFTIHDQTLEEAGYAKWHSGAPYNYNSYGFLCRDGTFIDNSTYAAPFICEKKPVLLEFFN